MGDFSHLSDKGEAAMVDVSAKAASHRTARVQGSVTISRACAQALDEDALREITTTARIAAIQAAKKTSELIPLCHQVPLSGVEIGIHLDRPRNEFFIHVVAKTRDVTGVEMEAFVATSVAALTVYDMIKAKDPAAVIGPARLVEKTGGKTGHWTPGTQLA